MQLWSCHLIHLNAKIIPCGLSLRNGGGGGPVFVPSYILLMPLVNQVLCIFFLTQVVLGNRVEQERADDDKAIKMLR